jgi:glycosyltransferase involved in cell wall biosynthesis
LKSTSPIISVALAIHDRGDDGYMYLEQILNSLNAQTSKNFELVVSDSSQRKDYKDLIQKFKDFYTIEHILYNKISLGGNVNNAIKNSSGEVVKILCSDDLIISKNMIKTTEKLFRDESLIWLLYSSVDFDYVDEFTNKLNIVGHRVPKWNDDIIYGFNTISGLSVITFRNNKDIIFDDNLRLYIDVDLYYTLKQNYGMPKIIKNHMIANRSHSDQDQRKVTEEEKEAEIDYIVKKHNLQEKKIF